MACSAYHYRRAVLSSPARCDGKRGCRPSVVDRQRATYADPEGRASLQCSRRHTVPATVRGGPPNQGSRQEPQATADLPQIVNVEIFTPVHGNATSSLLLGHISHLCRETIGRRPCRCRHPYAAHQHYRGGSECSACSSCTRYRANRTGITRAINMLSRGGREGPPGSRRT